MFKYIKWSFFILLFLIMFVFFYLLLSPNNYFKNEYEQKPAIIAGYKSGSILQVRLLIYPDSIFYFSNFAQNKLGKWRMSNDTTYLYQNDRLQAILVNDKASQISNPRLNWLDDMDFIRSETPKVFTFPTND